MIKQHIRGYIMAKSKSDKRIDSTNRYLDALMDTYSKLNIVRVDLAYKKPYSDAISFDSGNDDLTKMLDNRRSNRIFNNNVGYIGKKEYTEDKGVHFHMIFFYDGQKVRHDTHKAQQIGNYWNECITDGQGTYHNCNMHAEKIYGESNALGMLEHSDAKKREKVKTMASYLCKDNYQSIEDVKSNSRSREFVRGTMPKKKDKKGRPRKEIRSV